MLFGIFFAFWRLLEIITLIPTLGMLSYFVHIYTINNALSPNYVLVLFIVSVLGAVWAIATLFTYHRTKSNALFVSFIDLCFVGALIAGVYELRFIGSSNCTNVPATASYLIYFGQASFGGYYLTIPADKTCSMLKACFAFGIMNCIFFFITSFMACLVGRNHERDRVVVEERVYSKHGRHRSGSHRSHRSSQSGHRSAYV